MSKVPLRRSVWREPFFRAASVAILLLTVRQLISVLHCCRGILPSLFVAKTGTVVMPESSLNATTAPYYGSLQFQLLQKEDFRRFIDAPNDEARYQVERDAELDAMDATARQWMALDQEHEEEEGENPYRECRKNNWQNLIFTNCNTFHEILAEPLGRRIVG